MSLQRLTDLVVIVPGIMGSVLQKDGRDLWAVSGQAAWQMLKQGGPHSSLEQLLLKSDDPETDDLGDGIIATRLMPNAHYVPVLCWIDGYSDITNMLTKTFQVVRGDIGESGPANLLEFPYDWRRDNRAIARRLKRVIDERLLQWRHTGNAHAKVILVGHSMGGLIARYYLEVLEGWRECKALITFGTPFRGSVKALDFLVNGCKKAFVDCTDAIRSFTSVYQLLPIYKMVHSNNVYGRIAEIDNIPHIARDRAEQALQFHRSIEAAVKRHRTDPEYLGDGYKMIPVVGTRQPTFQSAELDGGNLTILRGLPAGIDEILNDGDGTVPRCSAIPIDMSNEFRDSYFSETHGSLQRNRFILDDLRGRLQQMQVTGMGEIRGPAIELQAEGRAAIALHVDDFYDPGEPVILQAELLNTAESAGTPEATIERADDSSAASLRRQFHKVGESWRLELGELDSGVYRVEVRTSKMGPEAPPPVHGLFAVAG